MAIINKSNTSNNEKDYWRTPPNLIADALLLLGIETFDMDVCANNNSVRIRPSRSYLHEEDDALKESAEWFYTAGRNGNVAFCNPPFSKKWEFFEKAKKQVSKFNANVLMVLPYTPCTNEWHNNVHNTNCIIYIPDGRYQYLLPDGSKPKNSCNFETCLVLLVPFKCGNVIVNYKRGVRRSTND